MPATITTTTEPRNRAERGHETEALALSMSGAAERVGLSRSQLYAEIAEGRLVTRKVAGAASYGHRPRRLARRPPGPVIDNPATPTTTHRAASTPRPQLHRHRAGTRSITVNRKRETPALPAGVPDPTAATTAAEERRVPPHPATPRVHGGGTR